MDDTSLLPASGESAASVYRYYDSTGVLIYVGITKRGLARNLEHASRKEWWPFVATQEVEHFRTVDEARCRERELIHQNRPPFNVQHNPSGKEMRSEYLATMVSRAGDGIATPRQVHETYVATRGKVSLCVVEESGSRNKITFRTTTEDWPLAKMITVKHRVQIKDASGRFLGVIRSIAIVGMFAYLRGDLKDAANLPTGRAQATLRLDSSVKPATLKLTNVTVGIYPLMSA